MSELPVEGNLCLLYMLCISFTDVNFIKYLESKHDVEKFIAEKNNRIEEHRKRWCYVYKYFHSIKTPTASGSQNTNCVVIFHFSCTVMYCILLFKEK